MPGIYASNTDVSVERSKAEIERLVIRYGATGYSSAWFQDRARIEFLIGGRRVRIEIGLPDKDV